jgi:hypothetical protein
VKTQLGNRVERISLSASRLKQAWSFSFSRDGEEGTEKELPGRQDA